MASIKLTPPGCWPAQVPFGPKVLAPPSCLGVDDISASEVKTGSRTLLVTPYDPDKLGTNVIYSGQYGQWQVLTGLGGQIHRGMYLGSSVKKDDSVVEAPGVAASIDKTDSCKPGEKALAIRDRGRWYVTKMGTTDSSLSNAAAGTVAIVYGGNVLQAGAPYETTKDSIYDLARFPKPQNPARAVDWAVLDLPLNWKHGDPIPAAPNTITHTWPRGVGLARLARNSTPISGSSWNADLVPVDPLVNVPARLRSCHVTLGATSVSRKTIYCYFDKGPLTDPVMSRITITKGAGGPPGPAYAVTDATVAGNVLVVTVAPDMTAGDVSAGLTISFQEQAVVACTDASTGDAIYLIAQSQPVTSSAGPGAVADVAIRGAVIEPDALNAITVYMSGPVGGLVSTVGWLLAGGTPALTLSSVVLTDGPAGIITVILDRPVTVADLSGQLTIGHTNSIVTRTALQPAVLADTPAGPCATGAPTHAIYKAARSCYVRVVNRITETPYSRDDIIDVSRQSYIDVKDANDLTRRFYDSRAVNSKKPVDELVVSVIGGNDAGNGYQGIQYAEILVPDKVYDPNVDTVYPPGLGRALLYKNSVLQLSKVLVRHDFGAYVAPLVYKQTCMVLGRDTIYYPLPVVPPPATPQTPPPVAMTVYRIKAWR